MSTAELAADTIFDALSTTPQLAKGYLFAGLGQIRSKKPLPLKLLGGLAALLFTETDPSVLRGVLVFFRNNPQFGTNVIPAIVSLLNRSRCEEINVLALEAFAAYDETFKCRDIQCISTMLQEPSLHVRTAAAKAAASIASEGECFSQLLVQCMGANEGSTEDLQSLQIAAALAFGEVNVENKTIRQFFLTALGKLLGHPERKVRRAAVKAFVKLDRTVSIPVLCEHIANGTAFTIEAAIEALTELKEDGTNSIEFLASRLEDNDPTIVAACAIKLVEFGHNGEQQVRLLLSRELQKKSSKLMGSLIRGMMASESGINSLLILLDQYPNMGDSLLQNMFHFSQNGRRVVDGLLARITNQPADKYEEETLGLLLAALASFAFAPEPEDEADATPPQ